MSGNYCYVDEKVLDSYIKKHFTRDSLLIGSNYEVLCSLLVRLLCEDLYKLDCLIGFKLRHKYISEQISPKNAEECIDFFKKVTDNDTPVDFAVSPLVTFNETRNKIHGWTFQLKRFGNFQTEKDTEGLLKFLIKQKSKYAKTGSSLVIFFDGHKGVSLKSVCESKDLVDFPFDSILFIEVNKIVEDQWVLRMGQMWPIYGYNEYDPVSAIKEGVLKKYEKR